MLSLLSFLLQALPDPRLLLAGSIVTGVVTIATLVINLLSQQSKEASALKQRELDRAENAEQREADRRERVEIALALQKAVDERAEKVRLSLDAKLLRQEAGVAVVARTASEIKGLVTDTQALVADTKELVVDNTEKTVAIGVQAAAALDLVVSGGAQQDQRIAVNADNIRDLIDETTGRSASIEAIGADTNKVVHALDEKVPAPADLAKKKVS